MSSDLSPLQEFASLAPNGALPPSKVCAALKAAHSHKACNYTGHPVDAWAEEWGAVLRLTMSQYMKLLQEPQRSRTLTRAMPSQNRGAP